MMMSSVERLPDQACLVNLPYHGQALAVCPTRAPSAAAAMPTQHQDGPCAREHEQDELHVHDVTPDDTKTEVGWHYIATSVSRREGTAGVDRVREQRRRHARQKPGPKQGA